jgi:hypothetical protein
MKKSQVMLQPLLFVRSCFLEPKQIFILNIIFAAIMVLTNSKILQFDFPGIQSYMFDKIDSLPLYQLMQPRKLFYECLSAGLMPDGAYVSGKPYGKVTQAKKTVGFQTDNIFQF